MTSIAVRSRIEMERPPNNRQPRQPVVSELGWHRPDVLDLMTCPLHCADIGAACAIEPLKPLHRASKRLRRTQKPRLARSCCSSWAASSIAAPAGGADPPTSGRRSVREFGRRSEVFRRWSTGQTSWRRLGTEFVRLSSLGTEDALYNKLFC